MTQDRRTLYAAAALIPLALVLDFLDGRVARWRHKASPLARELDSLADVISFGVATADIATRRARLRARSGRAGLLRHLRGEPPGLFFEGAEPTLDDFPLEDLLALFPEGKYKFTGVTVEGKSLNSTATLTHAVPDDRPSPQRWTMTGASSVGTPSRVQRKSFRTRKSKSSPTR